VEKAFEEGQGPHRALEANDKSIETLLGMVI
jgi:hypothetical protein